MVLRPRPALRQALDRAVRAGALQSLPFVALILIAAISSYRYHLLLQEQRARVEHTYEVLTRLESTLIATIDAETGQRGYVLTGEDRYLRPYEDAKREVPTGLVELRRLVADSGVQLERTDFLERSIAVKFSELEETIAARHDAGFDAARTVVLRDRGRIAMDSIRDVVGSMERQEQGLLCERAGEARSTERKLLVVTIVCAALSLLARIGLARLASQRSALRPEA